MEEEEGEEEDMKVRWGCSSSNVLEMKSDESCSSNDSQSDAAFVQPTERATACRLIQDTGGGAGGVG